MVTTILPLYLVVGLGLSPLQFGVVDGLYQGATALVRLAAGFVADRGGRYKAIAAVGYGLSAVCKLGLLASAPRGARSPPSCSSTGPARASARRPATR